EFYVLRTAVLHRLKDLNSRVVEIAALQNWPSMTFAELQAMLAKRLKTTIPIADRDGWEHWFEGKRTEASTLRRQIADAEAEIDARVYRLFELTPTEIAAVEDALAVASPALSLNSYEAISAVEGLELSEEARRRLAARAGERVSA
ncbi:MAG: hypothetical protein J2O44_06105, partial [Porphyrobacter sp.]|nr:hypothetical protein [Porphyrobacter sp.]